MRILFVTSRPPWQGRRGDQARVLGLVRQLAPRHAIHVLSQSWSGEPSPVEPWSGEPGVHEILPGVGTETVRISRPSLLAAVACGAARWWLDDRRPLQASFYRHADFAAAVARRCREFRPDVAVVMLSRLGDVLPHLRIGEKPVPVVLDLVDALALNMAQRARRQPLLSWLWWGESRRFGPWDQGLVRSSAAATVVAERDRRAVLGENDDPELASRLRVVPFGLALPETLPARLDPPAPSAPASEGALATVRTVALTGNLGYFPTVDGARWFAREVWPRVRAGMANRTDGVRWLLAGARPAKAIRRLVGLPGVELVPNPDDLRALSRRATVAIAPLRSGSGTPIKILEAMADGVPVVTTPEGAGGLDGLPEGAVAVADSPEAFADAVLRRLQQPESAQEDALRAWHWLDGRHRLERTAEQFESLLEEVAAGISCEHPPGRR